MDDERILGHGQIGAERKFLKDAAHAKLAGAPGRVILLLDAVDRDAAAVRGQSAGEHMHKRRLARAVVADETDAFARRNGEVDAI